MPVDTTRRTAFLRDFSAPIRMAIPPLDIDSPAFRNNEWAFALYYADLWCDGSLFNHFDLDDFSELPASSREELSTCVPRFIRTASSSLPETQIEENNKMLARTHLITIFYILQPTLIKFWNDRRRT